jgi:hypothetical protein
MAAHGLAMAASTGRIWQMEQRVPPLLGDHRRVRRHAGTLASVVERDANADMIDRTIVRAHHCAVGIKKGFSSLTGSTGRAAGHH